MCSSDLKHFFGPQHPLAQETEQGAWIIHKSIANPRIAKKNTQCKNGCVLISSRTDHRRVHAQVFYKTLHTPSDTVIDSPEGNISVRQTMSRQPLAGYRQPTKCFHNWTIKGTVEQARELLKRREHDRLRLPAHFCRVAANAPTKVVAGE